MTYEYVNDRGGTGNSTIYGHQNADGAITVGAASFRQTPAFGVNPPKLETFSSVGGTPILFDVQGNRLATPEIRQKPEITAPDRVSTTVLGFRSFPGTSAAAPHVAAAIALMLQRAGGRKSLSRSQILTALQKGAIPIAPPGNFTSGAGLIQADSAILQAFQSEILGSSSDDILQGTDRAENLSGLTGNDRLSGAGSFDALFGNEGKDTLNGGAGNDYLLGGNGNDSLVGSNGDDFLLGSRGRDGLRGDRGNDELRGNEDNDTLIGGRGENRLTGAEGNDLFVFDRHGFARVQDFQNGRDRLGLPRGVTFNQLDFDQRGRDTLIELGNRTIARLRGIAASTLTPADFRSPFSTI